MARKFDLDHHVCWNNARIHVMYMQLGSLEDWGSISLEVRDECNNF